MLVFLPISIFCRRLIIHFGTCETIDIEKDRIHRFIEATGVSMVIGYRIDVNWADSTATDLIILDWLQGYRDMRRMWMKFKNDYKDLISITGLRAFHR